MDENASRAVFLGVSVFIAIITLTLIINFYDTAKKSASVANRYDVSNEYNKDVYKILDKEILSGVELRYLLNYLEDSDEFIIAVYNSAEDETNNVKVNVDTDDYWSEEYQKKLDNKIRPNYNYSLDIHESGNRYKIVAVFEY